ncbi:hypothetical protein GCM10010123_45830 [Pilimelia anulata]|uniref:Uncharacterized protein n=1 Tax=Pilimelia anulata TaxID=53371 RepID=A0A8J3FDD5_9ACTN|nr:hypothetical protein [Pilimelia anulata]GGK10663.1 hypothetical protein GCM10010123_45830 [Pilimelia anulata]
MSPRALMAREALDRPRNVESFVAGGPRCPHDGQSLVLVGVQLVCQDCGASWTARGLDGRWPSASRVPVGRRVAAVAAGLVAAAALVVAGLYSAPAAGRVLAAVPDAAVWTLAGVLAVVAAVLLAIGARGRGGRR